MSKPHWIARILAETAETLRDGLGVPESAPQPVRTGYGHYELPTYMRKGIYIPGVARSVVVNGRRHGLH